MSYKLIASSDKMLQIATHELTLKLYSKGLLTFNHTFCVVSVHFDGNICPFR